VSQRDFSAKNLDVLVESHRIYNSRRRAGKPVWDRTIDVHSILARDIDNTDTGHCVAVGIEIGALLRSRLAPSMLDITHADYDREIDEIVECLEGMSVQDYEGPDNASFSAVNDLNSALSGLYDWADLNRVWLRGPSLKTESAADVVDAVSSDDAPPAPRR
jgi:hypothetical protein